MQENKDRLLEGSYDGIQEYDNDLPRWWRWLFYVTIIFSVAYVGYYWIGPGESSDAWLASDMKELESSKAKVAAAAPVMGDAELMALTTQKPVVEKGGQVFATRCAACHGQQAQGLIGPNLTDHYWLHGGKLTEIKHTIEEGVLDKGMLSWKATLTQDEIGSLVAYIWSVRDTNPPGAKAPQGDLIE